jgi:alpha-beta hydrolase superfamily lysophospholipase
VGGATRYLIQESTSPSFTSPTNAYVSAPGTSRQFSHSPAGTTTYYYRVIADNEPCGLSSGFSNTVDMVVAVTLPAPTLLTPANGATNVSTTPTFTWTAVAGADAGYRILVATSPGVLPTDPTVATCSGCVINATPGGTSYTPSPGSLSANTTYYWKVHGRSSTTFAAWSSAASFRTSEAPLPPTGFTARVDGQTVTVSWSPSPSPGVTAYRLHYGVTGPGRSAGFVPYGADRRGDEFRNLPAGTYDLALTAVRGDRESDFTPTQRAVVQPDAPPDTTITGGPSGTISATSATFTWAGSDDRTPAGSLVYAWYLQGLESGYGPFQATTSRTYTGLQPGRPYTFFVKARDDRGQEDPTPASRSFTVSAAAPELTRLDPDSVGPGRFRLTITGRNFDSGAVDEVYLGERLIGSGATGCALISRSATQLIVEECMAGSPPGTYTVKVRNADRQLSNGLSLTLLPERPLPPPSFTARVDGQTVTVSWSPSPSAGVTAYRLHYGVTGPGRSAGFLSYGADRRGVEFRDVPAGTYDLALTAVRGDRESDFTPTQRAVVQPDAPPDTTITGGPSGTISATSATFTWAGSDDRTPAGSLVYAWYLQGLESGYGPFQATTSRTYTGLQPGRPYTFFVKARDDRGQEDPTPASRSFTVSGPSPTQGPPVVVLTHGWVNTAPVVGGPPNCLDPMRDSIKRVASTNARVFSYWWQEDAEANPFTDDNFLREIAPRAYAHGMDLARQLERRLTGPDGRRTAGPIHLIGHSLGTIVITAAERTLIDSGFNVEHLTFLDIPDCPRGNRESDRRNTCSATVLGSVLDSGDPVNTEDYAAILTAGGGATYAIDFVDNYYGVCRGCVPQPTGWELNEVGVQDARLDRTAHTDVQDRYQESIGTCVSRPTRNDGFQWSRAGGGWESRPSRTPWRPNREQTDNVRAMLAGQVQRPGELRESNAESCPERVREAVILVHGWHGSPDSWGTMGTLLEQVNEGRNFEAFRFDYSERSRLGNASTSIRVLAGLLKECIDRVKAKKDCSTGHDLIGSRLAFGSPVHVVAHSMGGLRAKAYIAGLAERNGRIIRYDSDIDKLITLATPHYGSRFDESLGSTQVNEMDYTSTFIWELDEVWRNLPFATGRQSSMMAVVGTRDGVVEQSSASFSDSDVMTWNRITRGCALGGERATARVRSCFGIGTRTSRRTPVFVTTGVAILPLLGFGPARIVFS